MAYQIALMWNDDCEAELIKMGFKKQVVYVKDVATPGPTKRQIAAGDSEFFTMKDKPFQFVTTSYWGARPD